MKQETLNVRIDSETKSKLKKLCEDNNTTISDVTRDFILRIILYGKVDEMTCKLDLPEEVVSSLRELTKEIFNVKKIVD